MKSLFPCMLALFLLASTCGYAQVPISGTPIGEKISTTVKTYTLTAALPIAKQLIGQKIAITGTATAVTIASKTPVWFILVDGTAKVSVVNKIGAVATANPIGQKVAVLGNFAVNSITQALEFLATGVTILSDESTTNQDITKAPVVYGEAIPATAKVMTLSTAMPMAKSLIGTKIVVTGSVANIASANTPGAWFWLGDGSVNVAVIKKISVSVPNPAGGQKVSLYGGFAQNPTTSTIQFHAVSLRIP